MFFLPNTSHHGLIIGKKKNVEWKCVQFKMSGTPCPMFAVYFGTKLIFIECTTVVFWEKTGKILTNKKKYFNLYFRNLYLLIES